MVVHNVTIGITGVQAVGVAASLVTVINSSQLGLALAQKEKPVVIVDPKIARAFEIFLRVQHWWLLAALVAYAISRGYGVDFRQTE